VVVGRFFEGNSTFFHAMRYIVVARCFPKLRRSKPGFRSAQMTPCIVTVARLWWQASARAGDSKTELMGIGGLRTYLTGWRGSLRQPLL